MAQQAIHAATSRSLGFDAPLRLFRRGHDVFEVWVGLQRGLVCNSEVLKLVGALVVERGETKRVGTCRSLRLDPKLGVRRLSVDKAVIPQLGLRSGPACPKL